MNPTLRYTGNGMAPIRGGWPNNPAPARYTGLSTGLPSGQGPDPIMVPANNTYWIKVSGVGAVCSAVRARDWLMRGHYIYDYMTGEPLTVDWRHTGPPQLYFIVWPQNYPYVRTKHPVINEEFNITSWHKVYTKQINQVDFLVSRWRDLIPGVKVYKWPGSYNQVRTEAHIPIDIERKDPDLLEPAERKVLAWLNIMLLY